MRFVPAVRDRNKNSLAQTDFQNLRISGRKLESITRRKVAIDAILFKAWRKNMNIDDFGLGNHINSQPHAYSPRAL